MRKLEQFWNACVDEQRGERQGDHKGFLILTMHLLAAKPAPLGLAALAGRIARPYDLK